MFQIYYFTENISYRKYIEVCTLKVYKDYELKKVIDDRRKNKIMFRPGVNNSYILQILLISFSFLGLFQVQIIESTEEDFLEYDSLRNYKKISIICTSFLFNYIYVFIQIK